MRLQRHALVRQVEAFNGEAFLESAAVVCLPRGEQPIGRERETCFVDARDGCRADTMYL